MAAGAYKGLTIKIGADASKMTSALSGVNSAIFKTQGELRKLSSAAKLDPGNTRVAGEQLGAIAAQATNAAAKIDALGQGIRKIGDLPMSSGPSSIAKLAEDTKSVTLEVERAKQRYSELGGELNKVYSAIKKRTNGQVDLRDKTNEGEFKAALKSALESGKVTQEEANKIEDLKEKWNDARAALDDYTDAAKLKSFNAQLAEQEASLNSLFRDLAAADIYPSFERLAESLSPVNERMTQIDAAADVASEKFSRLDNAMRVDPGNFDTVQQHAVALGEALETTQMRADLLRQKISAYDDAGISRLSAGMGNVSVEVEQAERAFHEANRNLSEFRATGDETSDEFKELQAAASEAQKRMDTAHAVQQYRELQTQLAETDSKFVSMARSVASITLPSTVFNSMLQLRESVSFIGEAFSKVRSDASSFDSALKINPENVTVAQAQMKLLEEAERLAREEAALLNEQMSHYDTSAIEAATDSTKSAAQQIVDSTREYEEAAAAVREVNIQIADTQNEIDAIERKGLGKTLADENDLSALKDKLIELKASSEEAGEKLAEAGKKLDLSKQRKEYDDLEVKVAKNAAESDKLFVAMQKAQGVKIVPEIDFSGVERLKTAYSELKEGSFTKPRTGLNEQIDVLDKAIEKSKNRIKELDEALKKSPDSEFLKSEKADELARATELAKEKVTALREAYSTFTPSNIDETALATGRVGEAAAKSAEEAKAAFDDVTRLQDEITSKQKELSELPEAFGNTDAGKEKIAALTAEIEKLEAELTEAQAKADTAFSGWSASQGSKDALEFRDKLEVANKALVDFKNQAEQASHKDVTPKWDKKWADEVKVSEDRFKKLDEAMKLNPTSISVARDRSRALTEAIEATKSKVADLKGKLDDLKAKGVESMARNMGNVAVETAKAKKAADDAKKAVDELRLKYDDAVKKASKLKEEVARTGKGQNAYVKASSEVSKYATELSRAKAKQAEADAAATTANTVSEYKDAENAVVEYENKLTSLERQRYSSNVGGAGAAAVQAAAQIGQYAQQVGRHIIDSSDDVDKAYRNLRKTFDAEESDYKKLYDAAMEYSQSHVTSADTMLDMEAIAAQLGVGIDGGAEAIQKFADAAANLDVATDIDADTIALQMGQIMNVMGDVSTDNIDKFGDALVRLGNNMPTQESNIMQITQRLSAVGDVAGFTTPELMGWAAAIASTGQKSEAAASGISTTIMNISKAVSAGGDDVEKFAKVAGMSADEFVEKWRDAPSETLKKVVEGLRDSGDELFANLNNMDVNGVRQSQTLASLAQTVAKVDDSITMASDAFNGISDQWGASGDAAREAGRKAEGFSGSLAKLQNSAQVLAASFGDTLAPWIDRAAEFVQQLNDRFNSLDQSTKDAIVAIGGFAAGFAVIEPIVSSLGGHLVKVFSGAIGKIVKIIGSDSISSAAKVAFGGAGKAVTDFAKTGVGGLKIFGSAMGTFISGGAKSLAEAFMLAGGKTSLFVKALSALISPMGIIIGSAAIIAAALGVEYYNKVVVAEKETERFKSTLEEIKGVTDDLGTSLWGSGDAIEDYSEKWSAAKVNMDEYHDALKEHLDAQNKSREAMEDSVGSLERYKDTINDAMGKGLEYDGSLGKLQWAIDKLNESTGQSWTLQDVLTGKYKDQTGAIKSTKDAINDLIDAKQQEARISATESMLSENYKLQEENELAYKQAVNAYNDWMEIKMGSKNSRTFTAEMSDAEYVKWLKENDEKTQELLFDRRRLREEELMLEDQEKELTGTLDGLVRMQDLMIGQGYGARESIILLNDTMLEAAQTVMGLDEQGIANLALSLQNAGVSANQFADLGADAFKTFCEESGGDVNKLVEIIARAAAEADGISWGENLVRNSSRIENAFTQAGINIEEFGSSLDSAGISVEKMSSISASQLSVMAQEAGGNLDTLLQSIQSFNSEQFDEKHVGITVDDEGFVYIDEQRAKYENGQWVIDLEAQDNTGETVDAAQANADGKTATMEVGADTSQADSDVSAEEGKVNDTEAEMKVGADTSQADTDIQSAKAKAESTTATVSMDTTSLSSDPLAGYESKDITLTVNVVKDQLEGLDEMLAKDSYSIDVTVTAHTEELGGLNETLASLDAGDKTINVTVTTDLANLMVMMTLLALVPSEVRTNIVVTATRIATDTSNIEALNDAVSNMSDKRATYTATGNAATGKTPATNIQAANAAGNAMRSHFVSANVTGNAVSGSAAKEIWATIRAINAMSNKTIYVTTVKETKNKSATGAYIPYDKIPRHAAGIFTRPTLTNIGWVGEDGAELYSGNSLVPLTNRKYSMPYINDISDAVARKMGKELGGTGDSITITVNGVSGPDETAQAIARQLRLMGIAQGRR